MPITRRSFLAASSAVSLGAALPPFLHRLAAAAPGADQPGADETVLVVVQLTGGNDGLNTVIPYADPAYARARPTLKQSPEAVRRIDDELGFHPSLGGFAKLLEDDRLAFVQGVGYPNATRSHFESMDVWHTATADDRQRFGWLGRTRPLLGPDGGAVHVGQGEPPLALFGATGHPLSLNSLDDYRLKLGDAGDATRRVVGELVEPSAPAGGNPLLELARQSSRTTLEAARRFEQAAEDERSPVSYPENGLGGRLKLVAKLLDARTPERIFYTTLDGFDTHAAQAGTHARLLEELGSAVRAFVEDLDHRGQAERVLLLTFSEFGRRVRENGSQGTDHGAASQVFLVGDGVQAGPHGGHPSLNDLDGGDLRFHTDFRQVYATVLERWLGLEAKGVLDGDYELLDVVPAEARQVRS